MSGRAGGIVGKRQTEADGSAVCEAVGPDCTHSALFDKLQVEESKLRTLPPLNSSVPSPTLIFTS